MAKTDEIITLLRDSATAFLADATRYRAVDQTLDTAKTVDSAQWQQIAELGWLGLGLPENLGGSALGLTEACALSELLGSHALPLPYVACAVMPSIILQACATNPDAKAFADVMISGKKLITLAWQEVAGITDVAPRKTRLQHGRLTGSKLFVPAVESESMLLVSAITDKGVAIVAVDANTPGLVVKTVATGETAMSQLEFNNVPVLGNSPLLIGSIADTVLRRTINAARIVLSAQLAGITAACLEKTLLHLRDREQFGKPLAAFQALRHRAVDMSIAQKLSGASWRNAARLFDSDPDALATRMAIHAAKARCSDAAIKVSKESVQMHGAMGFTEEVGVGRYLRAAMFGSGWLGGAVNQRRAFLVARHAEAMTHG